MAGAPNDSPPEPPDSTWIDPTALAEAAARDHRSTAQRNHDALKAILSSGIIAEHLGAHRGLPVSTILTISIDDIERDAGVATTATGGTVPLSDALTLAQRSQPWLAVFDHNGLPLHLGRTKRLASAAQRLALIAALKGCSRPGCDAPASLSAVHHVLDYRKNGATDIDNLTLACDTCHALIHDGPGGWKTRTEDPHSPYAGRTAWIAPPHIDPHQTPRINHRHHAGELLAETLTRNHLRDEQAREQQHQRTPRYAQPGSTAA
ncbi:HNH endonuclease signature motif containing protein [Nocardia cyriacigeorgica]|nr:HNH endonuclease signature motif containing protein [Nocardia cyriacigeorgica]